MRFSAIKKCPLALICAACLIALLPGRASASVILADETAFVNQLQPGYYLEEFGGNLSVNYSYTGANTPTFSYTIDAVSLPLIASPGENDAISVAYPQNVLRFNFTSGNVTAIGANFFLTEQDWSLGSGNLTIKLSDGTSTTFGSTGVAFRGFTTSGAGPVITSLEISSETSGLFPTVDHLYVGAVIPEPSSMIAASLLLLPVSVMVLRQRKR